MANKKGQGSCDTWPACGLTQKGPVSLSQWIDWQRGARAMGVGRPRRLLIPEVGVNACHHVLYFACRPTFYRSCSASRSRTFGRRTDRPEGSPIRMFFQRSGRSCPSVRPSLAPEPVSHPALRLLRILSRFTSVTVTRRTSMRAFTCAIALVTTGIWSLESAGRTRCPYMPLGMTPFSHVSHKCRQGMNARVAPRTSQVWPRRESIAIIVFAMRSGRTTPDSR